MANFAFYKHLLREQINAKEGTELVISNIMTFCWLCLRKRDLKFQKTKIIIII